MKRLCSQITGRSGWPEPEYKPVIKIKPRYFHSAQELKRRGNMLGKKHLSACGGVLSCIFVILVFALSPIITAGTANADNLSNAYSGDWAAAFIDFIFSDGAAPFANDKMAVVADALRQAMSVYSFSMLLVGGIILFYHIAAMAVETAHHGVVMGKRANQVWAPIRLVVAVVLLIPVSGGLSVGQHIVLTIASSGSDLASKAWSGVAPSLASGFMELVQPVGPDIPKLVVNALNMEICREVYNNSQTAAQASDTGARLAGAMSVLQKIPAMGFAPEAWRYTNMLNALYPMCGEYRFAVYRPAPFSERYKGELKVVSEKVSVFSRAEADYISSQTRSLSSFVAPAFMDAGRFDPVSVSVGLSALVQTVQKRMAAQRQVFAGAQTAFANQYLAQAAEAGWVSAAFFLPDVALLQESYGEMLDKALPHVQEPIFAHRTLSKQALIESFETEQLIHSSDRETQENVMRFYAKMSSINRRIRSWLLGTQVDAAYYEAGGEFDLRDQVNVATDSVAVLSILGRAVDDAATSAGVWGGLGAQGDPGNPLSVAFLHNMANPLSAVIEFGRRQLNMGLRVIGVSGSFFNSDRFSVASSLVALTGGVFAVGGLALMFLIPLMPFVRFVLSVLSWLLTLIEAVVSVPWVALAHLSPEGDGLSGGVAKKAYFLWLSLAVRPVLIVFGVGGGILIFALGMFILSCAFAPVAGFASEASAIVPVVANAGIVLAYDVIACILAYASFRGISGFPQQLMDWLSPFVMADVPSRNDMPVAPAAAVSSSVEAGGAVTGNQLTPFWSGGFSPGSSQADSPQSGGLRKAKTGRSGGIQQSSLFPSNLKEEPPSFMAGEEGRAPANSVDSMAASIQPSAEKEDKGVRGGVPKNEGKNINSFSQTGHFADKN